jgi:oxygen-independent coproporphyrinogen-3 oxidase
LNRALPITDHQRLIREMILQLKTGKIDAGYFRAKFGEEILTVFREPYAELVKDGYMKIDGDHVTVTRQGILRIDSLLPAFFEPQFRNVRYT